MVVVARVGGALCACLLSGVAVQLGCAHYLAATPAQVAGSIGSQPPAPIYSTACPFLPFARSNYKNYCGNHRTLTQCVHELYYRGLIVMYSQTVRQAKSYYFAAQPARLLP